MQVTVRVAAIFTLPRLQTGHTVPRQQPGASTVRTLQSRGNSGEIFRTDWTADSLSRANHEQFSGLTVNPQLPDVSVRATAPVSFLVDRPGPLSALGCHRTTH
jgi:hypothetical protein